MKKTSPRKRVFMVNRHLREQAPQEKAPQEQAPQEQAPQEQAPQGPGTSGTGTSGTRHLRETSCPHQTGDLAMED